jgi:hypothetical protein
MTLKGFLTISTLLALTAFLLPWTVLQYNEALAFETCTRISFWLAVVCFLLFLVGLVRFRWRGLWLSLPMVVSWLWTAGFIWMWVGIMEACSKFGRCP